MTVNMLVKYMGSDLNGLQSDMALWLWPIQEGVLTSVEGMRILYGESRYHHGIDLAAPEGTPIINGKAGWVIGYGTEKSFGNWILIDNGSGYTTKYSHMKDPYDPNISLGCVRQGQVIGHVGNTGRSTGPHVDMMIMKDGVGLNEQSVLASKPTTIDVYSEWVYFDISKNIYRNVYP